MTRSFPDSTSGMTVLEVAISSAALAVVLLGGAVVARTALDSMGQSSDLSREMAEEERQDEELGGALTGIQRSSLRAVPHSDGSGDEYGEDAVPETMLEGTRYKELQFRLVQGISDGEAVVYPGEENAPMRLWLDEKLRALCLQDGKDIDALAEELVAFSVTREGRRLLLVGKHRDGRRFERTWTMRSR